MILCVASFALLLLKNLKFVKILWRNQKWAEENQRQEKKKNKKGKKDDKTPQELPAKKIDHMTNEELNALLIPGISMLDYDYGMECLLNN